MKCPLSASCDVGPSRPLTFNSKLKFSTSDKSITSAKFNFGMSAGTRPQSARRSVHKGSGGAGVGAGFLS